MNKWGLIIKAAGITGLLLIVRLVFDYLNYDVLSLTNLITAFISGAIFTIAIVFAGVLTDFKESEKIPGEIATSIRYDVQRSYAYPCSGQGDHIPDAGKSLQPPCNHEHELPE